MANVKYGRKFTAKTPYYKILERKNYEIEKKNVFLQSILKKIKKYGQSKRYSNSKLQLRFAR